MVQQRQQLPGATGKNLLAAKVLQVGCHVHMLKVAQSGSV